MSEPLSLQEKIIGIKYNKVEYTADKIPIQRAVVEQFGVGEKLDVSKLIDSQVLKLFKENCETIIDDCNRLEHAIYLGDKAIYNGTLKYLSNYLLANPKRRNELEFIKSNKTVLFSDLLDENEIVLVYSDDMSFPAHSETHLGESTTIKLDNPYLVKIVRMIE